MKSFSTSIVNFLKEEDGPTAVEYALMLAAIAMVVIVGARAVGTAANGKFSEIATRIDNNGNATGN